MDSVRLRVSLLLAMAAVLGLGRVVLGAEPADLAARLTSNAVECRALADTNPDQALQVAEAGLAAAGAHPGGAARDAWLQLRACQVGLLIERGAIGRERWRDAYDALVAAAVDDHLQSQGQLLEEVRRRRQLQWLTAILLFVIVATTAVFAIRKARQVQQRRTLSSIDELTGLANRRAFLAYAAQELTRTQESGGTLSLLMVDVDSFKAIKETHGADVGNEVLRHVGLVLGATLRERDKVGRYSGEEFITVLPNAGLNDAQRVAERMRATIAATPAISDEAGYIRFTVSIGVAEAMPGLTLEQVVTNASSALATAVQQGRNCVCASAPSESSAPMSPMSPMGTPLSDAPASALPPA